MASLFISRKLDRPSSPVAQWCDRHGIQLTDQSMLRFEARSVREWPQKPDWIFFYSPRAVSYALAQLPYAIDQLCVAAIGPGTGQSLRDMAVEPDFVGSGHPKETAKAFEQRAAGSRVVFLQAAHSRSSVAKALGNRIASAEVVVYDNRPAPVRFEQSFDVLVFTSPMNVSAFLAENELPTALTIIAIGPSTAEALAERNLPYTIAASAGEKGIVQTLQTLFNLR